jgi:hypothetical protein
LGLYMNSVNTPPPRLKNRRRARQFLAFHFSIAAAAVLVFSCDNFLESGGGGVFSTDSPPAAASALLLIPRRTAYKVNDVFRKSEDLSVCVLSEGSLLQVSLDQVEITLRGSSEAAADQQVAESYLFPKTDIYTITAQFKGMTDSYAVMVGDLSVGGNGNGNGNNGNGNGGSGIKIIWKD